MDALYPLMTQDGYFYIYSSTLPPFSIFLFSKLLYLTTTSFRSILLSPLPSLLSNIVPKAVGSSQHLLLSFTSFSTLIIIVIIIVSFCRLS
jgi:hypothetical protein